MSDRRQILAGFCVAAFLAAVPALAQQQPQTCPPPRGGMMMGMLSPEQRMMMMADARKATSDGSLSMQDYRAMQRDKLKAMTPEQRQAWAADLSTRWNALPPAEQQKLKDEAAAFRKERQNMMGRMRNCALPQNG